MMLRFVCYLDGIKHSGSTVRAAHPFPSLSREYKWEQQIDWDSATSIYSTDYSVNDSIALLTLIGQTPLNRSQKLPAPYKRLID